MMDFTRQDIFFDGDGVKLHGWLYRPTEEAAESESAHPPPARAAILLSHGFTALMELGLDDYAQAFTAAGFVCLVYDHRNWGKSEGFPRHETHPWVQVEDMRAALSFLRTLPGVDPAHIGLWGTSYSGGHAITVAALDRRVRCVVSQVPLVSGERTFASWVPADRRASFMERLSADRDARARGEPAVITRPAPSGSETEEWARAVDRAGVYPNALTMRSLELMRTYEPIDFIARISPTPLLMIVADQDTQTPVAWQLEAFALAGEPKQLITLKGRHYDPYMGLLDQSIAAALDWFTTHLS